MGSGAGGERGPERPGGGGSRPSGGRAEATEGLVQARPLRGDQEAGAALDNQHAEMVRSFHLLSARLRLHLVGTDPGGTPRGRGGPRSPLAPRREEAGSRRRSPNPPPHPNLAPSSRGGYGRAGGRGLRRLRCAAGSRGLWGPGALGEGAGRGDAGCTEGPGAATTFPTWPAWAEPERRLGVGPRGAARVGTAAMPARAAAEDADAASPVPLDRHVCAFPKCGSEADGPLHFHTDRTVGFDA